MKVTCESCGSKYTIKDEKVRGKRVKIRCKGCKSPIVVDGTALDGSGSDGADSEAASDQPTSLAPEAESTDTASMDAAGASPEAALATATAPAASVGQERWSVNLSETDSRDMTVEEIVAAWGTLVTDDAYVYKPGFADWKPILEVPELAALLEGAPGAAQDAFSPPAGPSPFAAGRAAASTRSGDLFGGVATAGSEDDPGIGLPGPAPAAGSVRPTGARNESSVLFSLDALKAGFEPAAPTPGTAPSADDPFGLNASTGFGALGGGFDQNQALLTAPPPEPKKPKKVASLAPGADAEPGLDRNKWLMIGAGVLVLLVAVGGVGYALGGGGSQENDKAAQGEGIEKEPTGDPRAAKAREGGAAKGDEESEDKSAKDESDTKAGEESEEKKAESEEKSDDAKKGEAEDAAKAAADKPAGGAVAAAAKPDANDKKDDKPKPAAKPAADTSGAPPFSKSAAVSALSSAAANAASCKIPGGPTGSGKAIVTFAPSGRVTTANVVGGKFGGTSVGGCVASRFRGARVPAFSGGPVTVSKSFTIK